MDIVNDHIKTTKHALTSRAGLTVLAELIRRLEIGEFTIIEEWPWLHSPHAP